ncbi:MAG: 2-C-methyl-D-erythritol 4-phosphate cytidylyltransferase [Clostridiales bacterium]|nr:2-C-methyl-D-erythritol 4-phosphate cytidylyltransferase [Clostridiales bacterium]
MKLINLAIILAAGSGKRFKNKEPKQFLFLKDKPILIYSLEKFEKSNLIDQIILVVQKDFLNLSKKLIIDYNLKKAKFLVIGGKERYESVINTIKFIDFKNIRVKKVCIHDASRPFVSIDLIKRVINNLDKNSCCVPAIKSTDTVRYKKIKKTKVLDREKIYFTQTPQAFYYDDLKKNYFNAIKKNIFKNKNITDDASLFELNNCDIKIINGDYFNIKITKKEDRSLAEYFLNNIKLI